MEEKVPKFIKASVALLALKDLSSRLDVEISCALTLTGSGFKVVGVVQPGTKDTVFMPESEHAWLFHTHLGSNVPPSKNDLSVALAHGYNKLKEAVHIIYDDYYIWWLCVKNAIENMENTENAEIDSGEVATKAMVAILATYENLLKKYKSTNNFIEFKENLQPYGISINRIQLNTK